LGFAWLSAAMPETKGLTLEQIEDLFQRPGDDIPNSTLSEQKEAMAALTVSTGGH